jgi:hypothetical protein
MDLSLEEFSTLPMNGMNFDRASTPWTEPPAALCLSAWEETHTWCLHSSATPPLGKNLLVDLRTLALLRAS